MPKEIFLPLFSPDSGKLEGSGRSSIQNYYRRVNQMGGKFGMDTDEREVQGGSFQREKVMNTELVSTLQEVFSGQGNWLENVSALSNPEVEAVYPAAAMVRASEGLGYCIDDRVAGYIVKKGKSAVVVDANRKTDVLKPGFVGGAGGWVVMYMMRGMGLEESLAATRDLYSRMNWGEMQAHIDNDHGHEQNADKIAAIKSGCGFLGKAPEVIEIANAVLGDEIAPGSKVSEFDSRKVVDYVLDQNGTIVVVVDEHKKNANVVVNTRQGLTLDRSALNATSPAYLWDMYASTDAKVLAAFNAGDSSATKLNADQFAQMQTLMHVTTGFLLGAFKDNNPQNNFALLRD